MMGRRIVVDLLVPAVLGGLAALGFAPWALYPITIAALIGLFVLWQEARIGRAAWRGFVFGLAHFGVGGGWLFAAVRAQGASTGPTVFATAGLIVYLACYPALAGVLASATNRIARPLWALFVVPAAWALTELLRGWIFAGLPGLALGYAISAAPLNGLVPLVGVHGLGLALMVAAATLWLLYAGTLAARLIALVVVVVLPIAIWSMPPPAHWTHALHQPLTVAVLQGNVASADASRAAAPGQALRHYRAMTARSDADLVIWPELALAAPPDWLHAYLNTLDADAAERGQTVLAGLLWPGLQGGFVHRVLALGAGHDKARREIAPVPSWLAAALAGIGVPVGRTVAGASRLALIHSHGTTLGVSTGLANASGRDARRTLSAAGILIDVAADDGAKSATARAQQLEIARMRAVAIGRPLARAADTGLSAIIGYDGRILYTAPADETARLVVRLAPRVGATPYAIHGDGPLWWTSIVIVLLGLIGAAALGWRAARRRRPAPESGERH